ncbi:MAG: tetratricopeptide repeat protein [Alphaproteobacteria bacterium]|nr:tetratricopeptide repeat protein [Alphaproteobacteria bacterium]
MKGPVHIGPYRLRRAIATSPVSEVWAATHGPSQRAVAVKILRPEAANDRRDLKAFRTELRNTAALSNPNIVHPYETGTVDELAARASGGQLLEGAPYLVMELCSGGSLDEIKRPFAWKELKQVLIALLDALAHMHARGVVHRALRPTAVLLNGMGDERSGLKLAGFGLAHHIDGLVLKGQYDKLDSALYYMAPEQLRREWRDLGPWTDLYSLGMVAWHLASNRRPWRELKDKALADAQLESSLPRLQPTGPVPEGFESWIERLTRKDHSRRFQRAADAAWALIRLGDVRVDIEPSAADALVVALEDEEKTVVPNPNKSGQFDLKQLRAQLAEPPTVSFTTEPELTESELTVFQGTLSPDIPPVPRTWEEKEEYRWSQPIGTGLGLFDHRSTPLVDRLDERTKVWEALRRVVTKRSAQMLVIDGPAGIGKSRLARWLSERAHELGAATVLKATHSRTEAPGTSVRRMFGTHMRLGKLDRDGVRERVKGFLFQRGVRQIDEVEALTELVFPSTRSDPAVRRVSGVEERHAVVRRFFRLLTLERPLIVWLEDAHWGNDALGLAYSVLENQRYSPMPVLFVLTVRDETLAERPIERALIEELQGLEGAATLSLGPLSDGDQHELVQSMLGLEESLAARVVDRTRGNPLLAVEIVGDWIQRNTLETGPSGFQLTPGEELVLPDDLHAVWMRRVERVLRGMHEDAAGYLEAAAVLGLEVDDEEWREVTDHPEGFHFPRYLQKGGMAYYPARARIRAKLADRLLDFRLAEETDTGWAFAHGMIRESLLRWARDNDRWVLHNEAAAAMLRARYERGRRDVAERLGRHLVAAGHLEQALEPLMAGVQERKSTLGVRPALALLATCEQTMNELGLSADDPRWGNLWITRGQLAFMRGDYDEAERWARQAALTASDNAWSAWGTVLQEALFLQAQIALRRSEVSGAEQLFTQLKASAADGANPRLFAMAMHGLGAVARTRGKLETALMYLGEARRSFEEAHDEVGVADCWKEMAHLDLLSGEVEGASNLFKRAVEVYERLGDRHKLALCLNGLAEVARYRGDIGEAESGYRHALQIFESVGSAQAVVARLNLALIHLRRGSWDGADRDGRRAKALLESEGRRRLLGSALVVLMAASAGLRKWDEFDQHLAEAQEVLRQTAFCEADAAWCAHKAGDLAVQLEQPDRARSAYQFAWFQYRGLGDQDAMKRVEALIGKPEAG